MLVQTSLSIPHANIRIFSGGHKKATTCNGLSKSHDRNKKGLFPLNVSFWFLFFNYLQKNEMRPSYFLQSSLPAQILSALISAVCLNSSKMFMIVTLSSCAGSSLKWIKSVTSFNTRAVQVLRHIDKSWLKTLIFSNNQSLPSAFQGLCSGFSINLMIS